MSDSNKKFVLGILLGVTLAIVAGVILSNSNRNISLSSDKSHASEGGIGGAANDLAVCVHQAGLDEVACLKTQQTTAGCNYLYQQATTACRKAFLQKVQIK